MKLVSKTHKIEKLNFDSPKRKVQEYITNKLQFINMSVMGTYAKHSALKMSSFIAAIRENYTIEKKYNLLSH